MKAMTTVTRSAWLALSVGLMLACRSGQGGVGGSGQNAGTSGTTASTGDVSSEGQGTSTGAPADTSARTRSGTASLTTDSAAGGVMIRSQANVVALAQASNSSEISAARLAQQQATNPAVKQFAARMIQDHTLLDKQTRELARQAGIVPSLADSSQLQRDKQQLMMLSQANGPAFDSLYVAQQVLAHQATLAMIDGGLPIVSDPALRSMLQTQARPTIEQHLQMAQQLQQSLRSGTR
jgi:putative membrane protein